MGRLGRSWVDILTNVWGKEEWEFEEKFCNFKVFWGKFAFRVTFFNFTGKETLSGFRIWEK